jgi:hypothetical protein
MNDHKFVFIGGLHRSGTTILFRCLRDHPQISGFRHTESPKDEGQHLQSVYLPARAYGGAGLFGFKAAAYLDETSPLITDHNRQKLFDAWKHYWDLDHPVLLEKSLPNLIRTRFLQSMFPHSYFIILLRHPVATTLATKKWRPHRLLPTLFEHWFVCYEQLLADSHHLHHFFLLQYEEFVANPQHMLGKIWEFLGVSPAPTPPQDIRTNTNEKYFHKWQEMETNLLMRFYARYMVDRFEQRANRFGYSFRNMYGQTEPGFRTTLVVKEG